MSHWCVPNDFVEKAGNKMAFSESHKHRIFANSFVPPLHVIFVCWVEIKMHSGRHCPVSRGIVWAELWWLILHALGALERSPGGGVCERQSLDPYLLSSLFEQAGGGTNDRELPGLATRAKRLRHPRFWYRKDITCPGQHGWNSIMYIVLDLHVNNGIFL